MAPKKSKGLLGLIGKKKSKKSDSSARKDLKLFEAMQAGESYGDKELQRSAKDHLWMHFTRHSPFQTNDIAKVGDADKKQILAELTLEVRNEAAHGGAFDLS